MRRPTFLVAEPEPEQALSSRKLLLETYKFNVITAHSEQEMFELLDVFPQVDAVILHDDTPGSASLKIVEDIRRRAPKMPVVALSPGGDGLNGLADHVVNSHDPEGLLHLLQGLFGDARRLDSKQTNLPGDEG
jgi:DNA-binding response OmpR family regulator